MTGAPPTEDLAAGVLARVGELLTGLSAADVAALAQGRARLAVIPVESPDDAPDATMRAVPPEPPRAAPVRVAPTRPTPSGVELDAASATLGTLTHRRDGTAYLTSWSIRDLRALAARLGLRGVAGLRKAELVERLVDRTIGFRLASTAVRAR
ncbi:Rho termination factor N-terminal domain-containing protein [Micromonospora sp. NPDC051925]|uniref:Rho termination factor N-terminal domain-containing protein n=1 Tax=Micromonospora sp. NPDC051925 TaxID=3364288 RepID=UPI0037C51DCD